MAQARTPPLVIYRNGCPHTLIITPAMLNAIEHRSDARFRCVTDYSGNSTHDGAVIGDG